MSQRNVGVTGIFSLRRSFFGPKNGHCIRNVTVSGEACIHILWYGCTSKVALRHQYFRGNHSPGREERETHNKLYNDAAHLNYSAAAAAVTSFFLPSSGRLSHPIEFLPFIEEAESEEDPRIMVQQAYWFNFWILPSCSSYLVKLSG